MNKTLLKEFLEEKVAQYNNPIFIESDPISIPHQFTKKEDIEIAGFLTATIAWGRRPMIMKNAQFMMDMMDQSPYDFIINHTTDDLNRFSDFKHRTFNSDDLNFFIVALKNIYLNHGGMEKCFAQHLPPNSVDCGMAIDGFRRIFFEAVRETKMRTFKHVSSPQKGSAAKRIIMFLRWMVRRDNCGVDFGIWPSFSPHLLSCPLDVHSGNVARKLGLLTRKQNDWKAVKELDSALRKMDAKDPSKYDFALFGLGVFENF